MILEFTQTYAATMETFGCHLIDLRNYFCFSLEIPQKYCLFFWIWWQRIALSKLFDSFLCERFYAWANQLSLIEYECEYELITLNYYYFSKTPVDAFHSNQGIFIEAISNWNNGDAIIYRRIDSNKLDD